MFNASEATKLANERNKSRKITLDRLLTRVRSRAKSGKYEIVVSYEQYRDEYTDALEELGFAVEFMAGGVGVRWE